ncbi:anamorsin homolog isoform X1 [Zea mays]|uniref:anamorsin homolog isoform X1 n=1 Tax=Zea mays TaxID=4577 RepID=UPI0009AA212F|nr:anamorsin homolog isoform X1 [Zea mays]|eukprot:XP_020403180.1 anamorsin homolog isoform X1 [Zea mays]
MSAALAVTDEVALPIRAVGDLAAAAEVSREEVAVITQCAALGGKLPFEDASVGAVLAVIKNVESLREQLVAEIRRVLKAGGRVLVQSPAPSSSQKPNTDIERKLLMGGFAEVQSSAASSQDSVQSVTVKAKKASWSMGSSFPLKKTTKALPKIQIDDDSDLIDEDSLLTEEDLKKPQLPVGRATKPVNLVQLLGDCEVGAAKKACKNCTCGRAEAEEKVGKLELTAEQINNPQSACGSCGLGDAFRCGTCPYRGLPPFKPGEKVSLSGNFLAADI